MVLAVGIKPQTSCSKVLYTNTRASQYQYDVRFEPRRRFSYETAHIEPITSLHSCHPGRLTAIITAPLSFHRSLACEYTW